MLDQVMEELDKRFVGRRETLRLMLTALLAGGHVLIEDVPGVGKTTLARAMAMALNCSFGRIQCTPDLLPADVLGYSWYDRENGRMVFRKGPIHHQVLLADEINRTPPKTQASFLEAMEERQVTLEGVTYVMEPPFWVIATQNPTEFEGTFPLPEAQLDRFLMRLSIGYPTDWQTELEVVRHRRGSELPEIQPVIGPEHIRALQEEAGRVEVSLEMEQYITALVRGTRDHEAVRLGVSPRGTIALYQSAQGWAYLQGRTWVQPEDVRQVLKPVLGHRIVLTSEARYRGVRPEAVLEELLARIPVKRVDPHGRRR